LGLSGGVIGGTPGEHQAAVKAASIGEDVVSGGGGGVTFGLGRAVGPRVFGRVVGQGVDGLLQLGREAELSAVEEGGRRGFSNAVGSSTVGEEQEREVVPPVTASVVRGAGHANECLLEPFDGTYTFVVLGSSLGEVGAGDGKNGMAETTGEVGTAVGGDASGNTVSANDVLHENV